MKSVITKTFSYHFIFSVRSLSEDELLLLSPEELCKDRLSEEYFRLKADYDGGDCRDVVRYVTLYLVQYKSPSGQFD